MDLDQDLTDIIYLDNAATVFPKPSEIMDSMVDIYKSYGVNPGRSGYDLCLVGGELVQTTRKELAQFFGGTEPDRLCFAYNASDALNILIQGIVEEGDHVISTFVEHNSVIRPLNTLQKKGLITVDYIRTGDDYRVDPEEIARHFRKNTKLVVVNHGSNVNGAIQPVADIGSLCRERGILFVVDTAQTAGVVPIDIKEMNIDALAFTGHKSLLAPTGIGGVYVREGVTVNATRFGGTGVESAYPYHLEEYPYRLEVGTANILGIVGLHLAQKYLAEKGLESIHTAWAGMVAEPDIEAFHDLCRPRSVGGGGVGPEPEAYNCHGRPTHNGFGIKVLSPNQGRVEGDEEIGIPFCCCQVFSCGNDHCPCLARKERGQGKKQDCEKEDSHHVPPFWEKTSVLSENDCIN